MKITLKNHESGKIYASVHDGGKLIKTFKMRHFSYQTMMHYLLENDLVKIDWTN